MFFYPTSSTSRKFLNALYLFRLLYYKKSLLFLQPFNITLKNDNISHLNAIIENVCLLNKSSGIQEVDGIFRRRVVMKDRVMGAMVRAVLKTTRNILAKVDLTNFVPQPSFASFAGNLEFYCYCFDLHRCSDLVQLYNCYYYEFQTEQDN